MADYELEAWAVISEGADLKPEHSLYAYERCMVAGRWFVGVWNWRPVSPLWVDTILLGEERFRIRPRIRISPEATCWLNLDGWPGTPYERRWPGPALDVTAFTEHVLTRPDDWMTDVARQDMRRILGGPA